MPIFSMLALRAARRALLLILFLASVTGCGEQTAPDATTSNKTPRGTAPGEVPDGQPADATPGAGTDPAPQDADAKTVEIRCDGAVVRALGAADLQQPLRLVTLVPEAARDMADWRMLILKSREGGIIRLTEATKELAGKEVRLYVGRDGAPAVGIFDRRPDAASGPAERPTQFVVNAEQILVWTQAMSPAQKAPAESTLTVHIVGGNTPVVLSRQDLSALTKRDAPPPPAGTGKKRRSGHVQGWHLLDIAGLALAKAATTKDAVASIRVLGNTPPVTIDIGVLKHEDAQPILRFNRRGLISFDLGGSGPDGKALESRARGVTTLEITPKR